MKHGPSILVATASITRLGVLFNRPTLHIHIKILCSHAASWNVNLCTENDKFTLTVLVKALTLTLDKALGACWCPRGAVGPKP